MTTNHLAKTEIIVFFISGIGNANGKGCVLLESFSSKRLNLSFPKDYQIGEFSKIYSIICISFFSATKQRIKETENPKLQKQAQNNYLQGRGLTANNLAKNAEICLSILGTGSANGGGNRG